MTLAEAGSSNRTGVDTGDASSTCPGAQPFPSGSESNRLTALAVSAPSAPSSQNRSKAGGAASTKHRHAIDDLDEGAFEGSVDAMDGFLDDLGADSD